MTSHFLSEMMQEYACIYQKPSVLNMLTTSIVNVMMTDKPTDQHIDRPRCLSTAHEQITDQATDGAICTQTHARKHVCTHARTHKHSARTWSQKQPNHRYSWQTSWYVASRGSQDVIKDVIVSRCAARISIQRVVADKHPGKFCILFSRGVFPLTNMV